MNTKLKVGDRVRYAVASDNYPMYSYGDRRMLDFSRFIEAEVVEVESPDRVTGGLSFVTIPVDRLAGVGSGVWRWPHVTPAGVDLQYWPCLVSPSEPKPNKSLPSEAVQSRPKVGDVVRFAVSRARPGWPLSDKHDFGGFVRARVTHVGEKTFNTIHYLTPGYSVNWTWPIEKPSDMDTESWLEYWPHVPPQFAPKAGDRVRYAVDSCGIPMWDYAIKRGSFAGWEVSEISGAGPHTFSVKQKDGTHWVWPIGTPDDFDPQLWPHPESEYPGTSGKIAAGRPDASDQVPPPKTSLTAEVATHPPAIGSHIGATTLPHNTNSNTQENSMSKHILALAAARNNQSQPNQLTGRLQVALAAALERQAQETAEAAATEILAVLRRLDEARQIQTTVIAEATRHLSALDRAMQYGTETENFVPLMRLLGCHVDPEFLRSNPSVQQSVPDDWQSATPAAKPAATGRQRTKL